MARSDSAVRQASAVRQQSDLFGRAQVGYLNVKNHSFEYYPTLVAPTNVAGRWIDGSAGGAATDQGYKWALLASSLSSEASFDPAESQSGIASMKLQTVNAGGSMSVAPHAASTAAGIVTAIPAPPPGTVLTCTYWMKTSLVAGASNNGAALAFVERTKAGTTVAANTGTEILTTTGWTRYTVSVTVAATTAYIAPRMQITGSTGAATLRMIAWFDDILIAIAPSVRPASA